MKNYKVDWKNKKIIITNDFANRANNDVNSNEYKEMRQLFIDYPTYTVKYRKNIVPERESHKDLTYKHMEEYIKLFELDNDETALDSFNEIKKYHKATSTSAYVKIKSWFLAKYPAYKETEKSYDAMLETLEELEAESAEKTAKTAHNLLSIEKTTENKADAA
jgi:hypothetical protein